MCYPSLVDIAWGVVGKLVKDWQKDPSMIYTEHDIEAELYARLTTAYRLLGMDKVDEFENMKYLDIEKYRSRVCCEPTVYYDQDKQKGEYCQPDIVVWGDEYSLDNNKNKHLKMAWACEIKWGGGNSKKDPTQKLVETQKDEEDVESLKRLVKTGNLKNGCALFFSLTRSPQGDDGWNWEKDKPVWICVAQLPGLKK